MLITFEGGEGCGKSTHARELADFLKSRGIEVVLTREPGGTKRGEVLRQVLLDQKEKMATYTELFLFSAARAELVEQVIVPALNGGKWVIADRYVDSTTAYQMGGRNLPEDVVRFFNMISSRGVMPELTFLLDVGIEEGLRRVREGRKELTKFEREDLEFHQRVRGKFLALAAADPKRVKVIDSSLEIEKVNGQIIKFVEEYL
jgi:dTMP kinase